MATEVTQEAPADIIERDRALTEIQDKVLWLSMQMVYHANEVRPSPDEGKVGGHQASSSSIVTLMTSLFFDFMDAGDRISVKPHASPVFHAIQYLLGNLDREHLTQLRAFHGLQAYPSRTKDPDPVDFSTGSVGLGAVAPNFAALTHEYAQTRMHAVDLHKVRYISVVGDAELDEGSVWEAIAEPAMSDLSHVLWVVDLNRQSLDRVIPGIRVRAWRDMFAANGWNVVDAKYGSRLESAYQEPNGELLRVCIDEMPNELYQRLLRLSPRALREWLPQSSRYPKDMSRFLGRWSDRELRELFHNLGGHDFGTLREAFSKADVESGPNVVFAYTLKGWRLPSVGDPQNHTVTLSNLQMEQLREELGIGEKEIWDGLEPNSPGGRLCAETRSRLKPPKRSRPTAAPAPIPPDFERPHRGNISTQQIFGLFLTDIARNLPEVSERIVTVSPDVASSTNLGGWINKAGVWARGDSGPLPEEGILRALKWEELPHGQHIELGISENNLFMMLGQLGLAYEMDGEMLYPIGTLYDPFVRRGLDAFVYSIYSGAKFIAVGTPSGITLAPEGGAHQSLITPSIGVEMPEVAFYEPCFGQELEWIMLDALENVRTRRNSTYLRLTSKRVDQGLFTVPAEHTPARERLRKQVLGGAHRLVDRSGAPDYRPDENAVHLVACGAMVPEAVKASELLLEEGVYANVVSVTGPGPLYRRYQEAVRAEMQSGPDRSTFMADVVPLAERVAPLVTVVDAHPHSLAWLGGAINTRSLPLGVSGFGQSGSRAELYKEYEIDVDSIMSAAYTCLGV